MLNDFSDDGKVLGVGVLDIQDVPGEESAIVLLDYMEMGGGSVRNLVKVRPGGVIIWIADLPHTGPRECYLSIDLSVGGQVFANTWNGYRVAIDADTGSVLGMKFTK